MIGQNLLIGTLGDIDNDGDLDLLTGFPHFLYLNNGDDTFVEGTGQSGIITSYIVAPIGFGDYDGDGYLDVSDGTRLFHNNGGASHWLRVELVGVRSNRSAIGARLSATAGDLRQMREILGGYGFNQDELVAHFGLGPRTGVERLEIRWPSGQMDVLEDIPADQKIRVIEARAGYYPVQPSVWITALPDSVVAGRTFREVMAVRPALFQEGARISRVVADLSELGGPEAVPLQEAGNGTWQVETTVQVPEAHGYRTVSLLSEQETSLGRHWRSSPWTGPSSESSSRATCRGPSTWETSAW
ncbi:MAG: CRTAC1 family protein [Candidatus Latescibacterota bacterium]